MHVRGHQPRRQAAGGFHIPKELTTCTCHSKQRPGAHRGASAVDLRRPWRRNAIRPLLWQVHQPNAGVLDDQHPCILRDPLALQNPQALTAKRVHRQSDDDEVILVGRSWCIVFDS